MGDDTDVFALCLEDRTLFDVQFVIGVHLASTDFLVAFPADPREFVAKGFAVEVSPRISVVLRVHPRENARGEHGGGETGALFVGPVHNDNRVFGFDAKVIHRPNGLERAQHAQNAIVFPARGLRVEVRAHIDRQSIRVGAFAGHEHIAHGIDAHRQARRIAPRFEQRAPFGVFVGQGLAITSTCDPWADLGHFHQTVPKTVSVHGQVGGKRCHSCLLLFESVLTMR